MISSLLAFVMKYYRTRAFALGARILFNNNFTFAPRNFPKLYTL